MAMPRGGRRLYSRLLGVLLLLPCLAHIAGYIQLPVLERIEHALYDSRMQWSPPARAASDIVIVDIDENSLAQLGRWPWSRKTMAGLVDTLFQHYRIQALGFDVVFAEADASSGLPALQQLAHSAPAADQPALARLLAHNAAQLDYDERFARSLKGRNVVLGYYLSDNGLKNGRIAAPAYQDPGSAAGWRSAVANSYGGNLPAIAAAAPMAGHFNPVVDADGVTRRVSVLTRYGNGYYLPLAVVLAQQASGQALRFDWPQDAPQPEALLLGPHRIPLDEQAAALVPYAGPAHSFHYYAAADVLAQRVPTAQLEGKVVLFGATAPGLLDLRVTPVGSIYPGVEVHANLLAGILGNHMPQQPEWTRGLCLLLLLLVAALLLYALPRRPLLSALALSGGCVLLLYGGAWLAWQQQLYLPLAVLLVYPVLFFAVDSLLAYFTEARSKRQLNTLFGQYVPPELVEEMNIDPQKYSMAGSSRELSILFTDVRGFTRLAEQMAPAELGRMMNYLMELQSDIVRRNGRGTIDKFIGDALMAFWNAPVDDARHAEHAVAAALELIAHMPQFNAHARHCGWPELKVGIGINTGQVIVGDMGSSVRRSYTAIGDPVNLAARLEGQSKHYGVDIVIGESTQQAVADRYACLELDRIQVVGKSQPVRIYTPLCRHDALTAMQRDMMTRYQQALTLYYQAQWDEALAAFDELQARYSEPALFAMYGRRIRQLQAQGAGAGWDGIFVAEHK